MNTFLLDIAIILNYSEPINNISKCLQPFMTSVIIAYCTRSLIINTIVICNIFPVTVDTSSDNEKEVSQLSPAVTMRRKCHS